MYASLICTSSSEEIDFKQRNEKSLLQKSTVDARSLKPDHKIQPHAHAEIEVDASANVERLHSQMAAVVRALVPQWKNLTDQQFEFKKCAGGLTNVLYRVSVKVKGKWQRVLVRIYADKAETLVDRDSEIIIWQRLHASRLGPRFYGTYTNGCVYGYVEGRPLNVFDIVVPELGVLVANTLGRMHALIEIPEFDKKPLLWDSINKWLTLVPKDFDHVNNKGHVERYLAMQIDLEAEAISLKEKLEKLNSPIVFCHNDINPGNIIYHEQAKSVLLIDYEYACYNYRGFDLANHFCEYTGIGLDWERFPTKEVQLPFLRKYLEAFHRFRTHREKIVFVLQTSEEELEGRTTQDSNILQQENGATQESSVVSEEELARLYVEVNQYTLASHLFWAIWGLTQAKNSLIDFDYFEYSLKRLQIYSNTKAAMLSPSLSGYLSHD